jgi:putative membrane protein
MEAKSAAAVPGSSPQRSANELAQDRTDLAHDRTDLAQERNDLALERTSLAHERTMMAWIRTSTSMISFGFGIYKFFDYFQAPKAVPQGVIGPRRFAIFMIGIALFVLAGAAVQNWADNRRLRKIGPVPRSLATLVAALVSILGILALIAVILHE